MTSPNRRLSLEEVLDEFFFSAKKPSSSAVLAACEAHPEYREDIMEFAALWSSYEASPEPADTDVEVSEESVLRLQSFVLNRVHELDSKSATDSDEASARAAIAELAGGKLKRAALAAGLGESTVLLTKAITRQISDLPTKVLDELAKHLKVTAGGLQRCFGMELAGSLRYKASAQPYAPRMETWEHAVQALPVSEAEKVRLLSLQEKEETP
jgi:hypothetical protein